MSTERTESGIAYDRAGPRGELPVLLLHAGVSDRRMWDSQWPGLTAYRDAVRLDFRGFGESTRRPDGLLDPVADVLATLAELDIERCHLVGASFAAGVAVELALTRPELAASLLLCAPGGSLRPEMTPDLEQFGQAEAAAFARDDLAAAIEANLAWWVDGPHRAPGSVDPAVRESIRQQQLLAFELTADWDDIEQAELDPPALQRLGEIKVPTLILNGGLDLLAIHHAADAAAAGIAESRRVDWPDVAHLPSMERPADFLALLRDWLSSVSEG